MPQPLLKRPGALPAAIALASGCLGLALASIPGCAVATIPIAAFGVLAGALSCLAILMQSPIRSSGILPVIGSGASLSILLAALFFPALLGSTFSEWRSGTVANDAQLLLIPLKPGAGAKLRLDDAGCADASLAAIQQDQVRVRIAEARETTIELTPARSDWNGKKFLVVRIHIQQIGGRHGLEFYHWGTPSPQKDTALPTLNDAAGNTFHPLKFEDNTLIKGQTLHQELHAGAIVSDLLVFETPPSAPMAYRLTLPAHAWAGCGAFKFLIPESFLKH